MQDARTLAVESLLRTRIDDPSLYEDEGLMLAARLHPEERLFDLAEAFLGLKLGLLAVTDRRILFVWSGLVRSGTRELPLADVTYADARTDDDSGTLVVGAFGKTWTFDTIEPARYASELAEAIRAALTRASRSGSTRET